MEYGHLNIAYGWVFMVVGIIMGSMMGMYAFAGPLKPPKNHENYTSLPRRLFRLAHIAFVALPLISIVYGAHIDHAKLSDSLKMLGSYSMIVGMIGVPTLLIGAAFYNAVKYLEVVPVSAVLLALVLIAFGQF